MNEAMKMGKVHLVEGTPDDITWKFTQIETYSAALVHGAQFKGLVFSSMPVAVSKNWALCKIFLRGGHEMDQIH
jgi:hypothetical protein